MSLRSPGFLSVLCLASGMLWSGLSAAQDADFPPLPPLEDAQPEAHQPAALTPTPTTPAPTAPTVAPPAATAPSNGLIPMPATQGLTPLTPLTPVAPADGTAPILANPTPVTPAPVTPESTTPTPVTPPSSGTPSPPGTVPPMPTGLGDVAGQPPASSTPATPAPAGTPAAPVATTPAAPLLPPPLALSDQWHVRIDALAGIGSVSELGIAPPANSLLPSNVAFTAGIGVNVTYAGVLLRARFSDSAYDDRYVTTQQSTSGGLTMLDVNEQKLDFDLTGGYEVLHHIDAGAAKIVTLTPFLGLGTRFLYNQTAPINVLGPTVGARVELAASDSLVLGLQYAFLPNLIGYTGVPLVFGSPKFDHTVGVDVSLRLVGSARIKLAYLSEYMTFTSEYRSYQTLAVGLDYGF